jgi:hypothetical protein
MPATARWGLYLTLLLVSALAAFFALQALYLALFVNSALPAWDIWFFLNDYYRYLDGSGSYPLSDLFARHNEHIIFTTRVPLFIDALVFHLAGIFPVALAFIALLLLAVILGVMSSGTSSRRDLAFATLIFLGLTWAIAQQENLALEFQVGWSLVHLFAAACVLAAAKALTAGQKKRWRWYALAFVNDFLATFSLASGLLVIAPLLAISLWLRRIARPYTALILFHLFLVAAYVLRSGGNSPGAGAPTASLHDMALYMFLYLGSSLGGLPAARIPAGAVILLFLAAAAAWGLWRSLRLRTPFGVEEVTLLGLGLFILCEAAVTTYGRSFFGIDQAASSRYGTASLVTLGCVFALAWRFCRSDWQRIPVATLLGCALWASNAYQPYVYGWVYRTSAQDDMAFALINGAYPSAKLNLAVTHSPKQAEPWIRRAAELGLGAFSPSATRYQPPMNDLLAVDMKALPPCRSGLDNAAVLEPDMVEIQGWAASPTKTGDNWVLAYDGAGRLVGYTRASHPRPDVPGVFRYIGSDRIGFDLFVRRDRIDGDLRLVIASSFGKPRACAFAGLKLPAGAR